MCDPSPQHNPENSLALFFEKHTKISQVKEPNKSHKLDVLLAKICIEEKTMPSRCRNTKCELPVFESPVESDTAEAPEANKGFGGIFDAVREVEDLNLKQAFGT